MDRCCLDSNCVSVSDKTSVDAFLELENNEGDNDEVELVMETAKFGNGKIKSLKETGQSTVNVLNKFTSQIKKPPHRRNSPLNWFPRKKVEPYLKRKIKLLQQEVGGSNMTLDETLGASHPHYSRVTREQMAAKESVLKAMEARKAAMVEASWCRILRAARIQSKDAENLLVKADKSAAEAFEAATAMGVIMYDVSNHPQKPCKIETSSTNGGGPTTHTVAASFETAFEVDKEVASAVKTAFVQLANCPSFDRDECKDLLRKISHNPDMEENHKDLSDISECESDTGSEFESEIGQAKYKSQLNGNSYMTKLADMMLERLKCLRDDELESLATIVATCGLNAALAEENSKHCVPGSLDYNRRMSSLGIGTLTNSNIVCFKDGQTRGKQAEPELPGLDKFFVKHMTKLEREVLEAKNTRRNKESIAEGKASHSTETVPNLESILVKRSSKLEKEIEEAKMNGGKMFEKASGTTLPTMAVPDLGSILIKHTSKFEREIEETKRNCGKAYESIGKKSRRTRNGIRQDEDIAEVPSLDKILVKRVSRLEREVQEAKNKRKNDPIEGGRPTKKKPNLSIPDTQQPEENGKLPCSDVEQVGKENTDLNKDEDDGKVERKGGNAGTKETENSLDKILVKPVHRLEREKMQALPMGSDYVINRQQKKQGGGDNATTDYECLDKVLVKHVSRLEKEKIRASSNEDAMVMMVKTKRSDMNTQLEKNEVEGGLDQIFVKHKSRLEREKMAAAAAPQPEEDHQTTNRPYLARKQAREKELQEAWGGLSLGNTSAIRPRLSKLERDKAAWIKAEEEERKQVVNEV